MKKLLLALFVFLTACAGLESPLVPPRLPPPGARPSATWTPKPTASPTPTWFIFQTPPQGATKTPTPQPPKVYDK